MMDGKTGGIVNAMAVASEMEKRGIALYKRAARIVSDDRLRGLLLRLLDEENSHLRYFESLRGDTPGEDEIGGSLSAALAADAFIPGGLMQMAGEGAFESMERMLDAAIQAENDSIDYYGKMLENASGEVRNQLEEVLSQERGHLSELNGWRYGE
ncbi:MAG: hypothetical protein LBS11_03005 [Oscillospiraceae bacterium]|jgi:rubrerythrin|nr:hypothetical protein [Oscillospiraceae bacterium]